MLLVTSSSRTVEYHQEVLDRGGDCSHNRKGKYRPTTWKEKNEVRERTDVDFDIGILSLFLLTVDP